LKEGNNFPPLIFPPLGFFLETCESKAAGHHIRPWETHALILTSSEIARESRNQGVIGGAEFYSENIVKRTDVICSVYDQTDLFLYRVFGLVFSYHGRPELITGQVEVSHNIVINAKQNIKPMSEVLNVNEISY
jgi:hypothetical protein